MLALEKASQALVQTLAAGRFELLAATDTYRPFRAVIETLLFAFGALIVEGTPTSAAQSYQESTRPESDVRSKLSDQRGRVSTILPPGTLKT